MIRINLLGQARPKAAKQAVPLEATLQVVLGTWRRWPLPAWFCASSTSRRSGSWTTPTRRIQQLQAEKASLQQIKQDVDRFESQKSVLQQRIDVIENAAKESHAAVRNCFGWLPTRWCASIPCGSRP